MVNYIAEQITIAESLSEDIKAPAKQQCFETILKLWEYHAHFPNGSRPFEQFEEIFRVLASLDPENPYSRHYSPPEQEQPALSDDVKTWVEQGKNLDNVAKILVSFSFEQAFSAALDESSLEWLKLIKDSVKSEESRIILKFTKTDENEKEDGSSKSHQIEMLTKRLDQLKAFEDISSSLRGDIENQVRSLNSEH